MSGVLVKTIDMIYAEIKQLCNFIIKVLKKQPELKLKICFQNYMYLYCKN